MVSIGDDLDGHEREGEGEEAVGARGGQCEGLGEFVGQGRGEGKDRDGVFKERGSRDWGFFFLCISSRLTAEEEYIFPKKKRAHLMMAASATLDAYMVTSNRCPSEMRRPASLLGRAEAN